MNLTALDCTALYCITLHCSQRNNISQHCTTVHITVLHFTLLQYNVIHCIALHFPVLHITALPGPRKDCRNHGEPSFKDSLVSGNYGHMRANCLSHVFADPMNPRAALIVKSSGANISANIRDGALGHKIDNRLDFL